eukprot:1147581-Pelagomonas_calceolata.AAC.6
MSVWVLKQGGEKMLTAGRTGDARRRKGQRRCKQQERQRRCKEQEGTVSAAGKHERKKRKDYARQVWLRAVRKPGCVLEDSGKQPRQGTIFRVGLIPCKRVIMDLEGQPEMIKAGRWGIG